MTRLCWDGVASRACRPGLRYPQLRLGLPAAGHQTPRQAELPRAPGEAPEERLPVFLLTSLTSTRLTGRRFWGEPRGHQKSWRFGYVSLFFAVPQCSRETNRKTEAIFGGVPRKKLTDPLASTHHFEAFEGSGLGSWNPKGGKWENPCENPALCYLYQPENLMGYAATYIATMQDLNMNSTNTYCSDILVVRSVGHGRPNS